MKKYLSLFLLLPFLFFTSCELFESGSDKDDDDDYYEEQEDDEQASGLQFNISGAKALAGGSSSSSGVEMSRSARASVTADLVKIMEDGTVEAALDFGENDYGWTPNISFMSVGDDGSVYICFESMYSEYNWDYDEETGEDLSTTTYMQFVRVYPDNHYDVLWPLESTLDGYDYPDESIRTWSWYLDMDSDPLVRDPSGNIYFMTEKYSNSTSVNKIYKYYPAGEGIPIEVTPTNSTMSIENFKVDSEGNIYIKSGWSGTSSWMRCYLSGVTAPETIYYSSDSTTWIRGYTTTPTGSSVILNGENIRGMNGIMKASDTTDSVPEIELLYSSSNNSSWINLSRWVDADWESSTELISYDHSTYPYIYEWLDEVKTSSVVDTDKILARVMAYYVGDVSIKDEPSTSGWDLSATPDPAITSTTQSTVADWIHSEPEDFLASCFEGKLMKDWLTENNLTSFYFGNIQNMIYDSSENLYGMYFDWSGTGNKVVKLLDSAGNRDLDIIESTHGEDKPTQVKFIGDYMYYRYAVMSGGYETGSHKLARLNMKTESEDEILSDSFFTGRELEILTFDVADDNTFLYFSALDYASNEVICGKVNLQSGMTYTNMDYDSTFSEITVF